MGMMDDFDNDFDFEEIEPEEGPPPEETGNRTFLIVAGIMGGILLLSLIVIAIYAMTVYPKQQAQSQTQVAEVNAQNTQIALSSQLTAEAEAWTATPGNTATPLPSDTPIPTLTGTQAPATSAPTNTPVVAAPQAEADTPSPHTKTVAALLTQQAAGGAVTPTVAEVPKTGFADNVGGVPGLLAIAGILIVVVILSRRLRQSSV